MRSELTQRFATLFEYAVSLYVCLFGFCTLCLQENYIIYTSDLLLVHPVAKFIHSLKNSVSVRVKVM